ncbi:protein-methionine-sulfoxide reductase heme-binding subunit MsrQ [Pragia fontium]|uniref:Protein-methionine-sulfoxide reductase heme-binding subunit MsrQ n=2 Tax=Pragia fontium TaxID=82985 RepID=A0AAJ5BGQ2_9GAMM|nr:protein-methionine-sulfoxide reductase heme-binding subunit MsrQ [Pragia fontium]AKJ43292.1 sulfite oxidase subunit YedZ [Pragia fontium]GKX64115.1 protein-methionine-sulfoxide reductase heme-binding subunit MsrQ [Pragia fontium]SFC59189.1 sulfoxide reductase heme-binding subunit YedZ [Pragia fontium DSM 5563 = ATCC 49100]VEJ56660.1 Flavocytochrome yedZ [Pragia fontium]
MKLTPGNIKWLKLLLHLAAFIPFLWLILSINQGWLGADAAKDIQHYTGRMALKLLLATLLITPLAKLLHQALLVRCRRLLGLWCFAWATLHLMSYSVLELGLDMSLLLSELIRRNYLILGIISWLILVVMAITSTQNLQRKLRAKWQTIHNFIYLVAILAPLHALLSTKVLSLQLVIYAIIAALLLAFRYKKLIRWYQKYK